MFLSENWKLKTNFGVPVLTFGEMMKMWKKKQNPFGNFTASFLLRHGSIFHLGYLTSHKRNSVFFGFFRYIFQMSLQLDCLTGYQRKGPIPSNKPFISFIEDMA